MIVATENWGYTIPHVYAILGPVTMTITGLFYCLPHSENSVKGSRPLDNDPSQRAEEEKKEKNPYRVPPRVSGPTPRLLEQLEQLGLSAGLRIALKTKELGKTFTAVQEEAGMPSSSLYRL